MYLGGLLSFLCFLPRPLEREGVTYVGETILKWFRLLPIVLMCLSTQACLSIASYLTPQDNRHSVYLADTFELKPQQYANSCGLAALSTAATAWAVTINEIEVYEESPPESADGYSLLELREITNRFDGSLYLFRADYSDFIEHTAARRPLILPVYKPLRRPVMQLLPPLQRGLFVSRWWSLQDAASPNHFVLVLYADESEVFLYDPAMGNFSVSRSTFEKQISIWSNVVALPVFQ